MQMQMQPLMNQPVTQPNPHVPPGLEYLTTLDKLFIKQKVELLEALVGFETKNKYTVRSETGHNVFYAVEDTDCCTRNCCGSARPFDMKIFDMQQREVIHMSRAFRPCDCCCCFSCCRHVIEVSSPRGTVVGYVREECTICKPAFKVENESGDTVLRIQGPLCTCTCKCGGSVKFRIQSRDGEVEVGKISKKWAGLSREFFTDADQFGISFPIDLDVRMKAVMLGACFLIDFMFFEHSDEGAACTCIDLSSAFS